MRSPYKQILLAAAWSCLARLAFADPIKLPDMAKTVLLEDDAVLGARAPASETSVRKLGWTHKGNVAANATLASSQSVVGQTDGSAESYGLGVKTSHVWADELNEWRTTGVYDGSLGRTSSTPRFVKSADDVRVDSTWLGGWPIGPNSGPYARLGAQTAFFAGDDARPAPVNYLISHRDGTTQTANGDALRLTDPFRPLTLKESVGWFWKPIDTKEFRLDLRSGPGAEQAFAEGQFAITGAAPNGDVSVTELRNLSQIGLEGAVAIRGDLNERVSYEATVESLTPFVSNKDAGDPRDPWRLTNFEASAKIAAKVAKWASVSYEYRLVSRPLLVDVAQQSHRALFNIQYDFF